MANFIIRVLLHDANVDHYLDLQQKLAGVGVVDIILATDGKYYKLPPAEYVYTGNESAETVRSACWQIARSTGRTCAVLVTKAQNVVWIGLAEAHANAPTIPRSAARPR